MSKTAYNIGLVQINNSFSGAGYFPYSIGLLQAYYQRYGQKRDTMLFLEPVFQRLAVPDAVEHLEKADLAAFSVYAWNLKLSLAIAKTLKEKNPNIIIAFGGPQLPREVKGFLKQYQFVDLALQGEGEKLFTAVLDHLPEKNWHGLSGLSFREGEKLYIDNNFERVTNLDLLPSPYLSGVFDHLVKKYDGQQWLGLWETNRGCPFACAFCDWGAAEQRRVHHFSLERAKAELRWFAENKIEFIFCCDSNFGLFEKDLELARYAADLKAETGYPKALSVQNAKNSQQRIIDIQEILNEAGLNKGVTLALQSATEEVLKNVHRQNMPFSVFADLQRHFTIRGISTYTDIILALPGETYGSFLAGIDRIIESGQYNRIQFINLSILPNSPMAEPAYMLAYGLQTVDSPCVNVRGSYDPQEAVTEIQRLVIGTNAMPHGDWLKCRAWSWMCSFLFFDKFLQIPLTLLAKLKNVPISAMVEGFMMPKQEYPLFAKMASFFQKEAERVGQGAPEYYYAADYLSVCWPHDEYCLIDATANGRFDDLYQEALGILGAYCDDQWSRNIITEAAALNKALMKTDEDGDISFVSSYNVWEAYKAAVGGEELPIEQKKRLYKITRKKHWTDFNDWIKQVIWFGNKKAAYWWPISLE